MTNRCKSGTCTRKPDKFGKGYCSNHAYQRGILQRHVPPHKAIAHINFLMEEKGMSLNHITTLAGISSGSMAEIKNGKRNRIRESTEQKILGVTKASGFPQGFVKSWPYTRRIQALLAIGWSANELAEEFGMSLASLREHAHGENPTMKRATASTIKYKFERM